MASIKDVLAYLLINYPPNLGKHLSNARVTKMVYLADWKHAIHHKGTQITDIDWYFDNFGPFDRAIQDAIETHPELFKKETTQNAFGNHKVLFSIIDSTYHPQVKDDERSALDHVIKTTHTKSWADFIKLVYSTYPVFNSNRYTKLNLPQFAREYAEALELEQFA